MTKQQITAEGHLLWNIEKIYIRTEEQVTQVLAYEEQKQQWISEDKSVIVALEVVSKGGRGYCSVSSHIETHPFQRHTSFAASKSIGIVCSCASEVTTYLAHYRHKDWWTRPAWGSDLSSLPARTQVLLFKNSLFHSFLFAVSDGTIRSEMEGEGSSLVFWLSSDCAGMTSLSGKSFVFSVASTPSQTMNQGMEYTRQLLGLPKPIESLTSHPLFTRLGWCTWDALYHNVNEVFILEKAKEFQEKQIPVGWFLIDDGWLNQEQQFLKSFQEDSVKFPTGFSHLVSTLEKKYNVGNVGVWHALSGYWGGVHPEAEIADSSLVQSRSGALVPSWKGFDAFSFYALWYDYLHSSGISFVKVDGQSALANQYEHLCATTEAAKHVHASLEAAASLYFHGLLINCMGMSSQSICSRKLGSISRNSDDFVPQDEDGFAEHALQNVYNALYHGTFYHLDWDMFWTQHPQALQHLVLRLVSGGPLYISDPIGKTDENLLRGLFLQDGSLLRCDHGVTIPDACYYQNPTVDPVLLGIQNQCQGSTVNAFFHIHPSDNPLEESFIPSSNEHTRSYVWDILNKTLTYTAPDEAFVVKLEKKEVALYQSASIVHPVEPIGIMEKYLPIGALSILKRDSDVLMLKILASGSLAFIAVCGEFVCYRNAEDVTSCCVEDRTQCFTLQVAGGDIITLKSKKVRQACS